jgi:alpha-L-fucosidase
VPDAAVEVLEEVGRWMRSNGESIYGTGPPDPLLRWDHEVEVVTAKPGIYYLHVFNWPDDSRVFLYDFRKGIRRAYLLADAARSPLHVEEYRRSLMIHVPQKSPDPIDSVVVVEVDEVT